MPSGAGMAALVAAAGRAALVAAAALARARRRAREVGGPDALRFAVLVVKHGASLVTEGAFMVSSHERACSVTALLGRDGEGDDLEADLLVVLELELPPAGVAQGSVLPPGFALVAQARAPGSKSSAVLSVGVR
jgi:hypothetical protein